MPLWQLGGHVQPILRTETFEFGIEATQGNNTTSPTQRKLELEQNLLNAVQEDNSDG